MNDINDAMLYTYKQCIYHDEKLFLFIVYTYCENNKVKLNIAKRIFSYTFCHIFICKYSIKIIIRHYKSNSLQLLLLYFTGFDTHTYPFCCVICVLHYILEMYSYV